MSIDTQLAKVKHNTQNIKTDCYKTVLISETTFDTLLISNYIEGIKGAVNEIVRTACSTDRTYQYSDMV